MHSHNVYFVLNDNSPEKIDRLIADSRKYLAPTEGVVSFNCGVLEPECNRLVNDRGFDVSLHILFKDKAAHDAYQTAELHNEYISRNKANWESVRVFDTQVR
jgi:stress responsive alpha/beta barrel protein